MSNIKKSPHKTRANSTSTSASSQQLTSNTDLVSVFLQEISDLKKLCQNTNSIVLDLQAIVKKLVAEGVKSTKHLTNLESSTNAAVVEINKTNSKIDGFNANLKDGFVSLTSSIKSSISEVFSTVCSKQTETTSYASAVKNLPVVVVKPKNNQTCAATRKDLTGNVDPISFSINSVRNASSGSIIIECSTSNSTEKLVKNVTDKLGKNYDIKIPKQRLPKIRVLGLSEPLDSELSVATLIDQNKNIFTSGSHIKILSKFSYKNSNRHGAKIELDPASFVKLMNSKEPKVRIGWDVCAVVEAFDFLRCFNCSGYHHLSKDCTSQTNCPKCSAAHKLSECTSNTECCVNCKTSAHDLKLNLDTAHPANSIECPVYKRKIALERSRTNYGEQ